MTPVVEINNLTKRYGSFVAVNNLNMTIESGAIYGFIGPNGAGKTTTMRILATLLAPTSGEARVCGQSVAQAKNQVRRQIGWMPDFFGVYDNMKVWEYLDFFAASYKVPGSQRPAMIRDLLALVDLSHKHDSYVDSLSRGMKQRLCLARTLVHDPALLILDEPASGLDPRARIELRELLRELSRMGKTILVSSHILTELAEMCTDVGIIERGNLLVSGKVSTILGNLNQQKRTVEIKVLARVGQAEILLQQMPGIQEIRRQNKPQNLASGPDQPERAPVDPRQAFGPPNSNVPMTMFPPGQPMPQIPLAAPPAQEPVNSADPNGPGSLTAILSGDDALLSAILINLVRAEIPVWSFAEHTQNLEDAFMQITKGLVI